MIAHAVEDRQIIRPDLHVRHRFFHRIPLHRIVERNIAQCNGIGIRPPTFLLCTFECGFDIGNRLRFPTSHIIIRLTLRIPDSDERKILLDSGKRFQFKIVAILLVALNRRGRIEQRQLGGRIESHLIVRRSNVIDIAAITVRYEAVVTVGIRSSKRIAVRHGNAGNTFPRRSIRNLTDKDRLTIGRRRIRVIRIGTRTSGSAQQSHRQKQIIKLS